METKNIPAEHKAQIFGRYLLQMVLASSKNPEPRELNFYASNTVSLGAFTSAYLLLRSITQMNLAEKKRLVSLNIKSKNISNIEVFEGSLKYNVYYENINDIIIAYEGFEPKHYDYLRSIGIATQQTVLSKQDRPVTYSVEGLIEANVFKILE